MCNLQYLGRPYKMRIAVTSHRRVNLCGSVIMSVTLFPAPIFGLFEIYVSTYRVVLNINAKSKDVNTQSNLNLNEQGI